VIQMIYQKQNIIKTEKLSIGYHRQESSERVVVSDIEVSASKGEIVAVLGRNGCGKSTLLRTIANLQSQLNGKVIINEQQKEQYKLSDFAKLVSFVSTETVRIHNMSVIDLIALGRSPYTGWMGKLQDDDREIVHHAIESVGIEHLKNKSLDELSDGERQRAMIARTLAQDTEIIILDEPTAFLDLSNRYEIVHLLHSLCRKNNKTIVYSTHDLTIAMAESDKIWLFSGEGVCEGIPEDLALEGKMASAFDSANLQFDQITGEFKRNIEAQRSVSVQSSDMQIREWTIRFFKRNGFVIAPADKSEMQVDVARIDNSFQWKIKGRMDKTIQGKFCDLQDGIIAFIK
jgi:iron complex transport system ATP-binding protein